MTNQFDFVIVGAGTAGCVLANRLSKNPKNSVLLIEAGNRDTNPWIHIPVGYFKTMHNPKSDWCYQTEPDPGLNGRSIKWPRGKVLGGSSSINGLIYIRGQKQDYDDWVDAGNPGWSYNDMLPYFMKCEHQERGADEYHGIGGNLKVSDMRIKRGIGEAFIQGAVEIGIPRTDDFNGREQQGAGYYQLTAWKGRRCSSAVGYLKPVRNRRNLTVLTNALVCGIAIKNNRAMSINLKRKGQSEIYHANRELILSAGSINTPQLLMLSGVGDKDHLEEFGISTKFHLPGVGQNLQDHLQIRSVYRCSVKTLNDEIRHPFFRTLIGLRYFTLRTGPMSMAASQIGIFTNSSPDIDRPDIQFHFQPLSSDSPGEGVHDYSGITSSITQLRPTSRGYLRLKSSHPEEHVAIHPNYLSTELDQVAAVNGMLVSRKIAQSNAMAKYVEDEVLPGASVQGFDELLDCARNIGETIYHPTGTCKMGPKSDPQAVVDSRLRVHGLSSLRIVDASIMPNLTSGNTNAPVFAIAEKAADMILEDN